MMLERLETRRFLSATALFDPHTGTVAVSGTPESDKLEVRVELVASRLAAYAFATAQQDNPADSAELSAVLTRVTVRAQGELVAQITEPAARVTAVRVMAGAGDDAVEVTNATPTPLSILGEEGADELRSTAVAASRGSVVDGGAGNDLIHLHTVRGASFGHVAVGGPGNDLIIGSARADELYGDASSDRRPVVSDGNDTLYGLEGDDALFGNGGDDMLLGGTGSDRLDGGFGADMLDGGDGKDAAVADDLDTLVNVEDLLSGK